MRGASWVIKKQKEALKTINLGIESAMTREEGVNVAQRHPREAGDLDEIWVAILSNLELPATRKLLTMQAKLLSVDSKGVVIGVSATWAAMVQSRLPLIETAVAAVLGSGTRVVAISVTPAP